MVRSALVRFTIAGGGRIYSLKGRAFLLGLSLRRVAVIKAKALGVGPARVARSALAWAKLGEAFIHSHRAIVVKRTALRWLRLLLSLAAASPGSSGNFGIVTQQIALIGFWQWLSLVSCLALSTPLVTQVQGVGAALAQVAGAARPGPTKANVLERHPVRRREEILR
jgi:hypothetical protein